jgi:hypothetical protein
MEKTPKESYVSIIGTGYLQPIVDLFGPLMGNAIPSSSSVTSNYNNGYSAASILLSVAMVESFIRRACLVLQDGQYERALTYVKAHFGDYSRISALEEIFVLRDVLAHNHMWHADSYWDEEGHLIVDNRQHKAGGDRKFRGVRDESGERTKILRLRLFPTAIRHEEAFAVFHEAVDFLLYLEAKGNNIASFSHVPVKHGADVDFFRDFLKTVPDPRPG